MAKTSSRRSKNVQPVQEPKLSPKAPSPSPSLTDSSMDDASNLSEIHPEGFSASRPASPMYSGVLDTDDSVTCQWEDCGKVFTHLPTLIDHIHKGKFSVCARVLVSVAQVEKHGEGRACLAGTHTLSYSLFTYERFFSLCYRAYWCAQIKLYM